jgi:hypothetical protein
MRVNQYFISSTRNISWIKMKRKVANGSEMMISATLEKIVHGVKVQIL